MARPLPRLLHSAAYRIALLYAAAFAVAIAALGTATFFAADAALRQQRDANLAAESAQLLREGEHTTAGLAAQIDEREANSNPNPFAYALFDAHGRRIAGSYAVPLPPLGWSALPADAAGGGKGAVRTLAIALPDGARLVTAVASAGVVQVDRAIVALFGGAFFLLILFSLASALLLGRYLRLRLERIAGTAEAIVAGDFERRVSIGQGGDEFDALGAAINAMLDRIATLMTNLRQVSSDIAHDLRTPLLRLRARLETMDASNPPPEAIEGALDQVDQALALFAGLLRIAEVEGGGVARGFGRVDLSALATELGETFAPAVEDSGRSFHCTIAPGARIVGDRELIAQAGANLLDNAIKHTPTASMVALTLEVSAGHATLAVADDGQGVPEGERERIAQRFVRAERSRSTPGHGLGLSLVRAIASAHGGELVIADNRPGLRVSMRLPLDGGGAA